MKFSKEDEGSTVYSPRFGFGVIEKVKPSDEPAKIWNQVKVHFPRYEGYGFNLNGEYNGANEPCYRLYKVGDIVDMHGHFYTVTKIEEIN